MFRILFYLFCLLVSVVGHSETESSVALLDNRFRVDPTIEQISFVIYRDSPSRSVILIRPDGKKYYADKHPDHVSWYQEPGMDIISITDPMPGPWQAIGKVTPKNNIRLLSNLQLQTDSFPERLYHNEVLKFTARLTQNGNPLVLKAFLERVRLQVHFIEYVKDQDNTASTIAQGSHVLGDFRDDGVGLDEVAGDGIFTVELPISVMPGKYRAIITSGNGVFLRATGQTVLVYPSPVTINFEQSHEENKEHTITVNGEPGIILPGTIAVTIEQTTPDERTWVSQSAVEQNSITSVLSLPYHSEPGRHTWQGTIFATEASNRELVLSIEENSFSVMKKLDIEQSTKAYRRQQEVKRQIQEQEMIRKEREDARMISILMIVAGNLIIIILGLIAWLIVGKFKAGKAALPAMQLDVPPK